MQQYEFDMTQEGLELEAISRAVDAGGLFVPTPMKPKVFATVALGIKVDRDLTLSFHGQVVNLAANGFFMVFSPDQDLSVLSAALEIALDGSHDPPLQEAPEPDQEPSGYDTGTPDVSPQVDEEVASESRRRADHTPVWQLIDPTLDVPLRRQVGALAVPDRLRLAKQASRPVRNILIRDVEKRVHVSVLKNPKISDEEILEYTAIPTLAPNALRWVASQAKYARRPEVRMNLITNPAMPQDTAVKLMATLNVGQLTRILRSPKSREGIQRAARRKLMNMGVL